MTGYDATTSSHLFTHSVTTMEKKLVVEIQLAGGVQNSKCYRKWFVSVISPNRCSET